MLKLNQSRKFVILGFFNFIITNFTLQILLIFTPIWISTFISQSLNLIIGYFSYSRYVFNYPVLNKKSFFRYLMLALISWYLNTNLIFLFTNYAQLSANLSALVVIPILTVISFFAQKYLIFR